MSFFSIYITVIFTLIVQRVLKQDNARKNTESVQCNPCYQIAYWAQTYRGHDLQLSRSRHVLKHVTIYYFLSVVRWNQLSISKGFEIFASKYI